MNITLSIQEIINNLSILDNYDYVVVEDEKNHIEKGIFISAKLLDEVKEFLEIKKSKRDKILNFVGQIEVEDRFKGKDISEIKKIIALKF
jgi:hypothetical protein